jgi:hypothetical protein
VRPLLTTVFALSAQLVTIAVVVRTTIAQVLMAHTCLSATLLAPVHHQALPNSLLLTSSPRSRAPMARTQVVEWITAWVLALAILRTVTSKASLPAQTVLSTSLVPTSAIAPSLPRATLSAQVATSISRVSMPVTTKPPVAMPPRQIVVVTSSAPPHPPQVVM